MWCFHDCVLRHAIIFFYFQCDIDAVEIDGEIKETAKNWFGLVENESIRLHVCDGLKFIEDSTAQSNIEIALIFYSNKNAIF